MGLAAFLLIILTWAVSHSNGNVVGYEFDESHFSSLDKAFVGSPPLLQSLAGKEEVIYILMSNFKQELLTELQNSTENNVLPKSVRLQELARVESYMKDFEETTGKLEGNFITETIPFRANHVAWNPLATYHMIRRFAVDLKRFVKNLDTRSKLNFRLQNLVVSVMKDLGWPSTEDLVSIMGGILRVQHVYNMNTSEIVSGKILDRETKFGLSGRDCHEIGKVGLKLEHYALAIDWLEMATDMLERELSPGALTAHRDLRNAIQIHDKKWERTAGWEHQYFAHKVSVVPVNRIKRRNVQFEAFKGGKTPNLNEINFWGLCDGGNYQSEEDKKQLYCWYETKISNAWQINPVKIELLSLSPLIVQYYEVIGNKMIEKIKREASPSLARSTVINEKNGARMMTQQRTSLSAWIQDIFKNDFKSVPKRIELMTGLSVGKSSAAEELQIASYAFGGHYEVHMDALKVKSELADRGDRIATFMIYLTDVEKGGSTAFPIAGVAAKPKKGSAVFWFNLYNSGEPDERTWHGACPVVLGEKWVANKWIRLYDQMKSHRCHSTNQTAFDFKVNGNNLQFSNSK